MVLMLIDTRELPPDPPGEPGRPWWGFVLARRLRWFAVVVALLVASYSTAGWLSLGFVYAALYLSVWRGLKLMPTVGGVRDHFQ